MRTGLTRDHDHAALVRITKFDVESRTAVAQYAYPLELASPPLETNGLSDLVAPAVLPMFQSLVSDLTTTPGLTPLDNIEGITLGPRLHDGR